MRSIPPSLRRLHPDFEQRYGRVVLTIRAMTGGSGYAERHLEHSDYYDETHRVQGEWHGRGAELLGLTGTVTREQFEAVREGLHPQTSEFLRPRHSADRTASDGNEQSKARSIYDLTFSAPKSVSIQALVGGDERLISAHDKAVREALSEAETHAATRVRLNGGNENRATANWIVAAYRHDASRELDPQLHTHAVAANLSYDGVEGRWKALQTSGLYERRAYLTEVYRNALAQEVRGLGYEIDPRRDGKGRDYGFEIRGVSDELLGKYSQRSVQRDAAIDQFTAERGRKPTDNEVAVLVRESRPDKLAEISTDLVREHQRARLSPKESLSLTELREHSLRESHGISHEPSSTAAAFQYAKEHLFERNSVAGDYDLMTEALRHSRGRVDLTTLRGTLQVEQASGALLRFGNNMATRESLDREKQIISIVDKGIGREERLGRNTRFKPAEHLRQEQKQAVEAILDSRDFAINLRGAAGTGKTATLQEIDKGLRAAGHKVVAVAPTRSAVEELRKVGFQDAMTISRLLDDQTAQSPLTRRVLIVDEAGMISGRQMEGLLRLAEGAHARVLFSGDTRQIRSVEASDALRILERESHMKSVSLTAVQRQIRPEYRDAIQTLRSSPSQGFEKLDAFGAVREVSFQDRAQAIASAYREATLDASRRVLVVAATHEEIGRVTRAIRDDLKERGKLAQGITLDRHVPLQWTQAQKADLSNYREGQVLVFHRAVKGIEKHELMEVIRREANLLTVQNQKGEERTLTARQARLFSVHDRGQIEVAPGDKLLLTGNRRDADFRATNGELVKVRSVEQDRIRLEDGRKIPANYRDFDHGYVVTAHRSQGKTVDSVIVSADAMKQELFYVAASRGRQEITVITSDKEQLRESLGLSTARPSVMELVRSLAEGQDSRVREVAQIPAANLDRSTPRREISHDHSYGMSP
jgi:conjugative relaxase-like TrwC/TraI family protein